MEPAAAAEAKHVGKDLNPKLLQNRLRGISIKLEYEAFVLYEPGTTHN